MSNIAEGHERDGAKGFAQFLSLSKGSVGEVRSQLYVAFEQGHIEREVFKELFRMGEKVSRMLSGLIRHLRSVEHQGLKYR